jgi:hypothetical protein
MTRDETPQRERASDPETERVREVLARAVRFLSRCSEDPKAALAAEDPRELMSALQTLAVEPPAAPATGPSTPPPTSETGAAKTSDIEADEAPSLPSIHIRRRRSA